MRSLLCTDITTAVVLTIALSSTNVMTASDKMEVPLSAPRARVLQESAHTSGLLATVLRSYIETHSMHDRPDARTLRHTISELLDGLHRGDTAAVTSMAVTEQEYMAVVASAAQRNSGSESVAAAGYEQMWSVSRGQWAFSTRQAFDRLCRTRPRLFTVKRFAPDAGAVGGLNSEQLQVVALLDDPDALEAHFTVTVASIDGAYKIIEMGAITTR